MLCSSKVVAKVGSIEYVVCLYVCSCAYVCLFFVNVVVTEMSADILSLEVIMECC